MLIFRYDFILLFFKLKHLLLYDAGVIRLLKKL